MDRTLYFKTQMMDSVPITGQTTYSFFTPSFENSSSVTEMPEAEALHWLFKNPFIQNEFVAEFFPDPYQVQRHFGLVEPFTSSRGFPGDIDLLLAHSYHPDKAIAFEVKRVKVRRTAESKDKVNKLPGIEEGIDQVNAYRKLGFYKTYLLVIILDDGRHIETPNVMFRYNKTPELNLIYSIPMTKEIHPEVGVIYIRINQYTGKHINHASSIGYCIDKRATAFIQSDELTNKVRSL